MADSSDFIFTVHFPFGIEFSPADTIFYQEELPNMFGGDLIKADAHIYVESVDYENAYCVLQQRLSINQNDMKKMLAELLQKMIVNQEEKDEIDNMIKDAIFNVQDTNEFSYYYYPGVPDKISCLRKTNFILKEENGQALESTTIELLYE